MIIRNEGSSGYPLAVNHGPINTVHPSVVRHGGHAGTVTTSAPIAGAGTDFLGQMGRRYTINAAKGAYDVIKDTATGGKSGLQSNALFDQPAWLGLVPGVGQLATMGNYGLGNLINNNALNDALAPADFIGLDSAALHGGQLAKAAVDVVKSPEFRGAVVGGAKAIGPSLGKGLTSGGLGELFSGVSEAAGAGARRATRKADEAAMEAAKHFAEQANRNAAFTPTSAKKIIESIAAGKSNIDVTALERAAIIGGETPKSGTYVVSAEDAAKHAKPLLGAPLFGSRTGLTITPSDLEQGVTMEAIRAKLALGEHGIIPPEGLFENIGSIQIGGTSPNIMGAKANSMFTGGAKEMKNIATTIFPDFRGEFKATPITQSNAAEQIDLLTQARGVPTIGSGRVLDTAGNEINTLSKTLWSANDHASAKAREASSQAVEQVLAKALDIKLSDEFLTARQARLDMVNDPNFNNVLIDFLGNSGKGGVGLKDFRTFLATQLEDPTLSDHQRGAYQQLLGNVLQGRYNSIGKQLDILNKQVEDPLAKRVHPDFLSKAGDYVDSIRRNIRNTPGLSPEQQSEMLTVELRKLSDAVFHIGKRVKKRRITWDDVDKRMKESHNPSQYFDTLTS
jgi:hypothetical protein